MSLTPLQRVTHQFVVEYLNLLIIIMHIYIALFFEVTQSADNIAVHVIPRKHWFNIFFSNSEASAVVSGASHILYGSCHNHFPFLKELTHIITNHIA